MSFLRYQEFYESKYDSIRERKFTLVEQMGVYCREYLQDRDASWSWTSDWSGFNIPVEIIKHVHDLGIVDRNHYDDFMIGVYGLIMAETMGEKAYLIGTSGDVVLDHELTHAMFYINEPYRAAVINTIDQYGDLKIDLVVAMNKQNYPAKTAIDEINAYITTGESGFFDDVKDQESLDALRIALRNMHRREFPEFTKELKRE